MLKYAVFSPLFLFRLNTYKLFVLQLKRYNTLPLFIENTWNSISHLRAHLPKILDTSPEKQMNAFLN